MSQSLLQNLLKTAGSAPEANLERFAPVARFYPSMDFMLYLKEDCSYRADRIDPFLTILLHPHEDKPVGIKIKGFRFIFERLKALIEIKEEQFLPLIKAIEVALVGGMAEAMMKDHEQNRVLVMYEKARKLAAGVTFDAKEIQQSLAA